MATDNTPYSVKTPDGWEVVAAYSRGREEKPSFAEAQKAFDSLLRNIRLENCVYRPAVVSALFHRIPGKVEAENFGHEGLGKSYYVKNTTENARYYRTSEPVPIETIGGGDGGGRSSTFVIKLTEGEWTAYTVNSADSRNYEVEARVKMETAPATLKFSVGDQAREVSIDNGAWTDVKLDPVAMSKGANHIKLLASRGTILIDWISLR